MVPNTALRVNIFAMKNANVNGNIVGELDTWGITTNY